MEECSLEKMITYKKVDTRSKYELFDAFLSDKGRLIYSAPFRRMQQKAQVFSLESNSAVRSRLSHSLEVAHIGSYISHAISKKIKAEENLNDINKSFWLANELSINTIVETTCLMHDIGNPPFGHFGESTISEWFGDTDKIINILKKAEVISKSDDNIPNKVGIKDFTLFDGNPQALRIATKIQGEDGLTGLNFTYTQLAASLKYTHGGSDYKKIDNDHLSSKLGFFSTEEEIVNETNNALGIPKNGRHPLTFIMEAADDISYCTSDIDDGIENKVVTEFDLFQFIIDNIDESNITDADVLNILNICKGERKNKNISIFTEFKTNLSKYLVARAATTFYDQFPEIMKFEFREPLLNEKKPDDNNDILSILRLVKKFTRNKIFNHKDVELIELSGFSILTGILNYYTPLLELSKDNFVALLENKQSSASKVAARLFRTLPSKCVNSYKASLNKNNSDKYQEWNLRCHLIIDYLSGMTDQYALEFFQSLAGIKVK